MCVSTCDRARTTIFCPPPRPTRRPLLPYTTLFRSQLERATIRERQAEGIAIAKKKGVYARTKRLTPEQITEARERVEAGEIGRDTSELQSRGHLVCRLLLEKKKKTKQNNALIHKKW